MTVTKPAKPAMRIGLWPSAIATGTYALLMLMVGTYLDTPFKQSGTGGWRLTAAEHGVVELAIIVGFVVVGVAVVFGIVVRRGLAQPAERTALRTLIIATMSVAAIAVFWTGLPAILAGGAVLLSLDARTRLGRLPATAGFATAICGLVVVMATWLAFAG